jgi:hypothetical protein
VENGLTELDLSPVPRLNKLVCDDNQLTELDLSPVPGLTKLYCDLAAADRSGELRCGADPEGILGAASR